MADDEAVQRVVGCLNSLAEAFAIYDRALFYYVPEMDEKISEDKRANTGLGYKTYWDQLVPERKFSPSQYSSYLNKKSQEFSAEIPRIYVEAINALMKRYEHSSNLHSYFLTPIIPIREPTKRFFRRLILHPPGKWILPSWLRSKIWDALRAWKAPLADRHPGQAGIITKKHAEKCRELANALINKFTPKKDHKGKIEKAKTDIWNPCTVEFGMLREGCELIMDEIDFLNLRVGELQQRSNHRWATFLTIIGLLIGLFTLFPHKDKNKDQKAYNEKLPTAVEPLAGKPTQPAPAPTAKDTPEPFIIKVPIPGAPSASPAQPTH